MHLKHDLHGLVAGHAEIGLQHFHDEFHWGVVIIHEHHFIQRRLYRLWPFGHHRQALVIAMFWLVHNSILSQ
jgi:hypothetical protein